MATANDTVYDRVGQARVEVTVMQIAIGLALVSALLFTLLFIQEPMVHDSLHNFRHSIGVTCH